MKTTLRFLIKIALTTLLSLTLVPLEYIIYTIKVYLGSCADWVFGPKNMLDCLNDNKEYWNKDIQEIRMLYKFIWSNWDNG